MIMYYRKFFSGVIEDMKVLTGSTITAYGGIGGASGYRSTIMTPVLCRAVVDVLKEIGFAEACCGLESGSPVTYGEIFPYGADKQGIQVFFGYTGASSYTHTYIRVAVIPDSDTSKAGNSADVYGGQMGCQITSSSTGINVPYRFYVTVKGDPVSFLSVAVGTYAAPESEIIIFGFGRGEDCLGNPAVCYSPFAQNSLYFLDLDKKVYINQTSPITAVSASSISYSANDLVVAGCPPDTVALIPWRYEQLLGVTLDNCYCVPKSLTTATTDQAFLIGGEEYWLLRFGRILAKCPTKL